MKTYQIFTDGGGFDKGGYNFRAVSSYRFFNESQELIHSDVIITETGTNQYAEICAIANAFENAYKYFEALAEEEQQEFHIKLYTDSMLCYDSLTKWIYGWIKKAKNGVFMTRNGPVLNQDQIKKAFFYLTELRKKGSVKLYHINSHTAKKDVKKLKKKFQEFNKCKVTDDEFLFIYLQNKNCDQMIQVAHEKYVEKQKAPNKTVEEKLKEEI